MRWGYREAETQRRGFLKGVVIKTGRLPSRKKTLSDCYLRVSAFELLSGAVAPSPVGLES